MAVTDLLPIPSSISKPTAYDVFGLTPGEKSKAVIECAVTTTIEQLKSAKDRASPDEWNQAARMVDQARQILMDPKLKATLDAKLAQPKPVVTTGDQPWTDPLAGLLPPGNPLEPIWTAPLVSDSTSVRMPPGSFGTSIPPNAPVQRPSSTAWDPNESESNAAAPTDFAGSLDLGKRISKTEDSFSGQARYKRRRKSTRMMTWLLGLIAISLLAITGMLTYLYTSGSSQIEIANQGDKIVIKANATQSESRKSDPAPTDSALANDVAIDEETASRDIVMGDLAADREAPNQAQLNISTGVAAGWTEDDSLASESITRGEKTLPSPPVAFGIDPERNDDSPLSNEASAQTIAIDQLRQQIRGAKWKEMKSSAVSLLEQPLTADNRSIVEGLYEVTDLATYYREGIGRAVASLQAGNEFEVVKSFRVIVVETGDDKLTVMYDKQRRTFTFDEFPFALAHRLASFQVSSGPSGQAAKAVYQAIAPRSTSAYRSQALRWLENIDGEVEDADTERLIETIQSIYSTSKRE